MESRDTLCDLVDAAHEALAYVWELREAWRTGAIADRDGKGGERSNRNVEVEVKLRKALESLGKDSQSVIIRATVVGFLAGMGLGVGSR